MQLSKLAVAILLCAASTAVVSAAPIAGYEAKSIIKGSKIDLDQADMEKHLDARDFRHAEKVYRKGGNGFPYAKIHLSAPLGFDVPRNAKVVGFTEYGENIKGTILMQSSKGDSYMYVHYNDESHCMFAGQHDSPEAIGCLAATGGLIVQDYGAVNYHYNIFQDNLHWGTLSGLSEHQAEKVFGCNKEQCDYPEYQKFYKFYGQLDYGNIWLQHALAGTNTESSGKFENANQDFSLLSEGGRAEFIKTATVTMNTFTQINSIMTELGIGTCDSECRTHGKLSHDQPEPCPQAADNWDLAVATFVGSMDSEGPSENGRLLYSIANAHCKDFGTCDSDNVAKVNHEIMNRFSSGRNLLERGVCMDAAAIKFEIDSLMIIPLIQGLLKSAYNLKDKYSIADEKEHGRGLAYAASIMPELAACNHRDAMTILDNFSLKSTLHEQSTVDFEAVRDAFERNYKCLQVKCEDIGGLVNSHGKYLPGAEPCNQRRMKKQGDYPSKPSSAHKSSSSSTWWASKAFLLCNVALVGAMLVVNRSKVISAVSGNADMIWSSLTSRSHQGHTASRPVSDLQMYEMQSSISEYRPIEDEEDLL